MLAFFFLFLLHIDIFANNLVTFRDEFKLRGKLYLSSTTTLCWIYSKHFQFLLCITSIIYRVNTFNNIENSLSIAYQFLVKNISLLIKRIFVSWHYMRLSIICIVLYTAISNIWMYILVACISICVIIYSLNVFFYCSLSLNWKNNAHSYPTCC